eukprot:4453064-Ditylum_brightwellii.AAC.1
MSYLLLMWAFYESCQPVIISEHNLPPNTAWLTDAHGSTAILSRVPTDEGIKMLGAIKEAMLDKSEELNYLLDKTTSYASATNTCLLKPHKTWLEYTYYSIQIVYNIPTEHYIIQQFKKITLQVYKRYYHRWGITKCFHQQWCLDLNSQWASVSHMLQWPN